MDRRIFLAGVAALPGAAMAGTPPDPVAGLVELLSVRVVNRDLFAAPPPLAQGMRLVLRRDLARGYDPAALAVVTDGGQGLGYLPPVRSQVLAALMDAGVALEARVVSAEPALHVSVLVPASSLSRRGPSGQAA
ncbi:MAG: HIRAN domain-containing protein [Pararhodobacter sp.]